MKFELRQLNRVFRVWLFRSWPLVILLLVLSANNAFAADSSAASTAFPSIYQDSTLKQLVLTGIDHTIRERYESADSVFAKISRMYPRSPAGPLFRTANLQMQMLDQEDGHEFPRLKKLIDATINKAQRWRTHAPDDPEPWFMQAAAYGYLSVYESHWGGWFAALKKGLKAANRFKKAVELDPLFVDAYLGLGSYQYWKSAKTGFINWLPFVADDRGKGIKNLRLAAEKGTFVSQTAETGLMWAMLDYGLATDALVIAKKLNAEYPESKIFWWGIGLCSFAAYRWDDCLAAFDTLEARYIAEGSGNYYNLIECAYHKSRAAFEAGDYNRSREECRRAFAYPAPKETRQRLAGKLSELEKRYRKLGKRAGK